MRVMCSDIHLRTVNMATLCRLEKRSRNDGQELQKTWDEMLVTGLEWDREKGMHGEEVFSTTPNPGIIAWEYTESES